MRCRKCDHTNPRSLEFCKKCGERTRARQWKKWLLRLQSPDAKLNPYHLLVAVLICIIVWELCKAIMWQYFD
jgi:hypothetical protein